MKKSFKFFFAFAAAALVAASCANNAGNGSSSTADGTASAESSSTEIMKQSGNFIFAAETPWVDAGGGAERQVLGYNDNIMMVKVKFEKGDVGAMHSHPHSQVTYVASGKFEFTIGGVTKIVSAGDALYKQPNIEHGCVCLEDGILIDCFNPMRDNFIAE